jgi:hypothetical protein
MTTFIARVALGVVGGVNGQVQVSIDSPNATPVTSFAIQNTGGWQTWTTVTTNMSSKVTGTHSVYLTFTSS